ncbi:MAG: hypothetical protein AAGF12_23145 [Myxococcota bacterium]
MKLPGLIVVCAIAAMPSLASAQPFFIGGGLGAGVRIDDVNTQFKLEQQFGYHFSGRPEGFFLGLNAGESFGDGLVLLQIGGRLGWDIEIARAGEADILLSPGGVVGIAVFTFDERDAFARFNWQFTFDIKFRVLRDQLTLFIRAVGLDFFAGDDFGMRFDFMAGAYLNF